jgi:hypothetical protein
MSCLICNELLHDTITYGLIPCVSHINTISPPKVVTQLPKPNKDLLANPLVLLPSLLLLHCRAIFRLLPTTIYHPFLQALDCPGDIAPSPLRGRLLGHGAWAMASGSPSHSSQPRIEIVAPHSSQPRWCPSHTNRPQGSANGLCPVPARARSSSPPHHESIE